VVYNRHGYYDHDPQIQTWARTVIRRQAFAAHIIIASIVPVMVEPGCRKRPTVLRRRPARHLALSLFILAWFNQRDEERAGTRLGASMNVSVN
jgi:hypothetical protein